MAFDGATVRFLEQLGEAVASGTGGRQPHLGQGSMRQTLEEHRMGNVDMLSPSR